MTKNQSSLYKKYSETQIANAKKWTARFEKIAEDLSLFKSQFLQDYLKITNKKLFWIYQINENEIIARFHSNYLYFDGKLVWFYYEQNRRKQRSGSPNKISLEYATKHKDFVQKKVA